MVGGDWGRSGGLPFSEMGEILLDVTILPGRLEIWKTLGVSLGLSFVVGMSLRVSRKSLKIFRSSLGRLVNSSSGPEVAGLEVSSNWTSSGSLQTVLGKAL